MLIRADVMMVIVTEQTHKKLRLRDTSLRRVTTLRFDPHSPTWADDLTYLFQRNIAKVRRENKKLFGSPDGPKAKK
jgi:hypothetical protein